MILNPSDFDFLLTKGDSTKNNYNRDSILEKFDPLTGSRTSLLPNQLPAPKFQPILERSSTESFDSSTETVEQKSEAPITNTTAGTTEPDLVNNSKVNVTLDSPKKLDISCGDESRSSSASESYVTASIGEPLKKVIKLFIHKRNNQSLIVTKVRFERSNMVHAKILIALSIYLEVNAIII